MVVVAEEIVVEVLVAKQENIGLSVTSVTEVPYVPYVIVFMDIVRFVMEPVKYTTANGILYFQTFVHHAMATENVKRVMAQVIAKSVEVKVDGMNIKKRNLHKFSSPTSHPADVGDLNYLTSYISRHISNINVISWAR